MFTRMTNSTDRLLLVTTFLVAAAWLAALPTTAAAGESSTAGGPNILLAISDDQSFPHASAYGDRSVRTPGFDRVARNGVLFTRAFCASPGCSPSRAALLTGRYPWQLEHAGTHASSFSNKFAVYPDLLERGGYWVGYTGKPWGPGNWKAGGRSRNPAGPAFNQRQLSKVAAKGISKRDYAGNFRDFLDQRPAGKPFCFWYGGHEPHRGFEAGSGQRAGKRPSDAAVPSFLPDTQEVRDDMLDYALEIENFDSHLQQMLELLDQRGLLRNTLVVVTSDNGMAFPRAKANCYEFGFHVPLAIQWPQRCPGGRKVEDLVSLIDLAPTFLQAAGIEVPRQMQGRSLQNVLTSNKSGSVDAERRFVLSARERHSSSRYNNLAYPQRAMRTEDYLLIRNFRPGRWPAGAPRKIEQGKLGPPHGGYHDIDACPTLTFLIKNRTDPMIGRFFHLAVDKRPAWELFDVREDPGCLTNLAEDKTHADRFQALRKQMEDYLRETADPRVLDGGDVFETYKRYSRIRSFPKPE